MAGAHRPRGRGVTGQARDSSPPPEVAGGQPRGAARIHQQMPRLTSQTYQPGG